MGRSYFIDVLVDSCVSPETFFVFGALRCCGGLQGGFLETVRKFDHVVALWVACVFPMFLWILAFRSKLLSFLAPCDAVAVSSLDSLKLCANLTMRWRCGSLLFFQCFDGFLHFIGKVYRFLRLAMLWWSPGWIPRNCTQNRACGGGAIS